MASATATAAAIARKRQLQLQQAMWSSAYRCINDEEDEIGMAIV